MVAPANPCEKERVISAAGNPHIVTCVKGEKIMVSKNAPKRG